MEDFNVTPTLFFAVLELALVLFIIALVFIVRSLLLARKAAGLQRRVARKKQPAKVEAVSFQHYLCEEMTRNRELLEHADEPGQEDPQQLAGLLQLRGRFLELEAEAQGLAGNAAQFREKLTTGISALLEEFQAQAITESTAEPVADKPQQRATIDTVQSELDSLKQVINNQQDAMNLLLEKLRSQDGSTAAESSDETATASAGDELLPDAS